MDTKSTFSNPIDFPKELVPLLMESYVCEYASISGDGTPITSPMIPNPGKDGSSIDVNTGLSYPWKAERARKNPKVCLLYSEHKALKGRNAPVVLVYGHAVVHDADLQGNTDRYVHVVRSTSRLFGKLPVFMLQWMVGYIARIWISIIPLKISWWPEGDMHPVPEEWHARDGLRTPPSDPAPRPLKVSHSSLDEIPTDWRNTLTYALEHLGKPILTIVDQDGYPAPFRAAGGNLASQGLHLELHPSMPVNTSGRACLTFHDLQIKNGEMYSNENYSFIGNFIGTGGSGVFEVERQLPSANFKRGLGDMIALGKMMMRMRKRLDVEAGRRGQPVPVVRLTQETGTSLYLE